MLDIKYIREHQQEVTDALKRRGVDVETTLPKLLEFDEKRRQLLQQLEDGNRRKNELAAAMKGGKPDEAQMKEGSDIKAEVKSTQDELDGVLPEYEQLLRSLPNIPSADVPDGGAEDFELIAESDVKPREDGKHYLELVGGLVDTERAAKVSGSRFTYITGQLARLEFALISLAMDMLMEQGFTPVVPPVLVKEPAMAGMGYLDHDGDEIYKTQDDLYLVGTSEQSIGPMHMDEILPAAELPLRYVGFSTCFRREAGSHGKDVRGMLRLHQFDKVEMFSFVHPEKSTEEHEFLLSQQRDLLDALELPYRVIKLAAGDLGAPSAKTYDIETWLPGEQQYRETNSTSNTTDYQARRLTIRLKDGENTCHAHMLNGTAFAIGRILIAIIENHQRDDGMIGIPDALHRYLPFTEI